MRFYPRVRFSQLHQFRGLGEFGFVLWSVLIQKGYTLGSSFRELHREEKPDKKSDPVKNKNNPCEWVISP